MTQKQKEHSFRNCSFFVPHMGRQVGFLRKWSSFSNGRRKLTFLSKWRFSLPKGIPSDLLWELKIICNPQWSQLTILRKWTFPLPRGAPTDLLWLKNVTLVTRSLKWTPLVKNVRLVSPGPNWPRLVKKRHISSVGSQLAFYMFRFPQVLIMNCEAIL